MSGDGEKEYVRMVQEAARAMWGAKAAAEFSDHVERTAKAVYMVSNYPLESGVEPVTRMRLEERR